MEAAIRSRTSAYRLAEGNRRRPRACMLHRTMTLIHPAPSGRFRAQHLFRPRSVAVLGAETPLGARCMANLLGAGFDGSVLPVCPGAAVGGVHAYPEVAALPVAPDLAVLACPAGEVPAALLAALVMVQTFSTGDRLTVDARVAGLAVAAVALVLRAPFLVVVVLAAATAAALRAAGSG